MSESKMKEQIEAETKVLESLWDEQRILNDKIKNQREKLQQLHKEYDESRTLTLEEIFQAEHLESKYTYCKKWCEEHGFSLSGYWPETQQYTIQIQFCVDDQKRLKKQKQNISTFLKIAKPREDGLVWMSVMENTLAYHGSYHVCYEKDKGFRVHRTYRDFITDHMNKDELFEWGVKNIPYGGNRDE